MFNLNFEIDIPKDKVNKLELNKENEITKGIKINNNGESVKLSEHIDIATILLNLTINGVVSIPFSMIADYLYNKLKGKTKSITFIKEKRIKIDLKKETIEQTIKEIYKEEQ